MWYTIYYIVKIDMFSAETKHRMPNVNTQPVLLIADTHIRPNNAIAATRQPPRLRAVHVRAASGHSRTKRNSDLPPPSYTAVNYLRSPQEADSGEYPYRQFKHDEKGRACKARHFSYRLLARARSSENAPATGLFALHFPLQRRNLPALFRGKFNPHFGY